MHNGGACSVSVIILGSGIGSWIRIFVFYVSNQTCRTLLEKQGRTHKWCTLMDPHTWPCKSRTTSTNIHSATMWGYRMLSLRTCLGRWTIGRSGERGSGISVLPARHDDDDDDVSVLAWGKVWIHLFFFPQLWVNSGADWTL